MNANKKSPEEIAAIASQAGFMIEAVKLLLAIQIESVNLSEGVRKELEGVLATVARLKADLRAEFDQNKRERDATVHLAADNLAASITAALRARVDELAIPKRPVPKAEKQ